LPLSELAWSLFPHPGWPVQKTPNLITLSAKVTCGPLFPFSFTLRFCFEILPTPLFFPLGGRNCGCFFFPILTVRILGFFLPPFSPDAPPDGQGTCLAIARTVWVVSPLACLFPRFSLATTIVYLPFPCPPLPVRGGSLFCLPSDPPSLTASLATRRLA